MTDTRTDSEKLSDLTLYGQCLVCGTPRAVTRTRRPDGELIAALACPAGCREETLNPAGQPRCPLCCMHGIRLTRNCGWCENDYDPDHAADVWIPDDEPMWKCPHGIGVDPERTTPCP